MATTTDRVNCRRNLKNFKFEYRFETLSAIFENTRREILTEIMSNSDPSARAKEIATVLGSGDDFEELQKSSEFFRKAVATTKMRNMETKRILLAFAKMREEANMLLMSRLEKDKENKESILGLESKISERKAGIEGLNGEVGSVEVSLKETEVEASKVRDMKSTIEYETVDVLPKTKYAFSLYSNITRLRWDYECGEDQLKGFVASLRDVRPFAFDIKDKSMYFTANYLWDVIGSA